MTTTSIGIIVLGVLLLGLLASLTIISVQEHKTQREAIRAGLGEPAPTELSVVDGDQ